MVKKINNEVFSEYFRYQKLSFLKKDLFKSNENKNQQMVKLLNDALIDLRNAANKT